MGSVKGVEQSLNLLRQVRSYFSSGMDHALEVATNMADNGLLQDTSIVDKQIRNLSDLMLKYVVMEREADTCLGRMEQVMHSLSNADKDEDVEKLLQLEKEEDTKPLSKAELVTHNMVIELRRRFAGIQHKAGAGQAEDEVEMVEEVVNKRCPYTGKEMVRPVTNVVCGHMYDYDGILRHIHLRGKTALCPVQWCENTKPVEEHDLVAG